MVIEKQRFVLSTVSALVIAALAGCNSDDSDSVKQAELGKTSVALLEVDGLQFKDLNKNGALDTYEDWRLSDQLRARDLVSQMTLEEKAGAMMHGPMTADNDTGALSIETEEAVTDKKINTFITRLDGNPEALANNNNNLQALAESSRLGIPVSISSDPRNHFNHDPNATSISAGKFSQWPEATGLAATGDADLVREFADIAKQEYNATGIAVALHPMADLATDPRWGRIFGTFGEDAELSKRMTQAYVAGFQGGSDGLKEDSVVAVVKHFSGGGPQLDGLDAHNSYGREQIYPGDNFAYHIIPFEGAFDAKVGSVMPYYGMPIGATYKGNNIEEVGFGFNKSVLTDILRNEYQFDGVILTDWWIVRDCVDTCLYGSAEGVSPWTDIDDYGMSWGVEHLAVVDRFKQALDAGVDQFGGVDTPEYLLDLVNTNEIDESRLDESVYRIMLQKFQQGLFEDAYVDAAKAVEVVGNDTFQEKADLAQRKSIVLLQNSDNLLPLSQETNLKLYVEGVNETIAAQYATVVDTPEEADIALLRVTSPSENRSNYAFGSMVIEGNLAFEGEELAHMQEVISKVPTIVSTFLYRPAVLTDIANAPALLGTFGASDAAVLDIVFGEFTPQGKLPFELPRSMAAVEAQLEDMPYDSENPLFAFGHGLTY